jgi:hypothetical protein
MRAEANALIRDGMPLLPEKSTAAFFIFLATATGAGLVSSYLG